MDRRETAALLAYVGRLDHRLIRTDKGEASDQLAQWHELLGDVPLVTPHGWDARGAALVHIRSSPYPIVPSDVARPWEKHWRDRLSRHSDPTPTVDPDNPAAWRAELLRARRAVAHGAEEPAQARAITSGRRRISPELEARLQEFGSCIPADARAVLAPYRRTRAAREAALAQGLPDVLAVRCDHCLAPVGEACRRRRVGPHGQARGNAPRATPHPSRLDKAAQAQRAAARPR
ncbi:zinc finger domain-containing protein [Actinacidiphila sp. bgisy144]|uniref:zinc finger domain-containing protein n=1 Tax=Actinacidiphila sp. bgisy144 TaxID=3413791 RepID=UPI003EC13B13